MGDKVLIGMSGGVDSSAAAAMLAEQGYQVIGITLKLYDYADLDYTPPDGGCCSLDLVNDARSVCARLDIPHYVIDLQKAFEDKVINAFIESYVSGRTPNPCVNCNTHIKWGEMLKTADKLDCRFVATGHYARIDHSSGTPKLLKAADPSRDQSYALWGMSKSALERTLFPLGGMYKTETRAYASRLGLKNANRPDSQEICFVPNNDYSSLIRRRLGDDSKALRPGPILDREGHEIGRHTGIADYTIGQRRGMGISNPSPLYVTGIDPENGSITAGDDSDLYSSRFSAKNLNLLIDPDEMPSNIEVKIRYRHLPSPARILLESDHAEIEFVTPQRAITPGQSAVFYSGERLLGGGIIDLVG